MKIYNGFFAKFIIFYISTVVIFALLYTYFSNDFYYSLSNKEIIFDKDYFYIQKNLEDSIKNNFKSYYDSNILVFFNNENSDEYVFNVDDLKVLETRINNNNLENDIYIKLKNSRGNLEYSLIITLKILDQLSIKYNNNMYMKCKISMKNASKALSNIEIEKIFKIKYLNETLDNGIIIEEKLYKNINEYIINNDGNPSINRKSFIYYIKHNFTRMFYLSMVTITTLGFGDIVPLTNVTRILIGLESTIGVVILGYFVNIITKE